MVLNKSRQPQQAAHLVFRLAVTREIAKEGLESGCTAARLRREFTEMEVSENQIDRVSLAALAVDAARMLRAGQFEALAASYGYALTYGREISSAIEEDLSACLTELGAAALVQSDLPPVAAVKYFKPGDHELFSCGGVLVAYDGFRPCVAGTYRDQPWRTKVCIS